MLPRVLINEHRDRTFWTSLGAITAWFTMRLTAIANGTEEDFDPALSASIDAYESRDAERIGTWA